MFGNFMKKKPSRNPESFLRLHAECELKLNALVSSLNAYRSAARMMYQSTHWSDELKASFGKELERKYAECQSLAQEYERVSTEFQYGLEQMHKLPGGKSAIQALTASVEPSSDPKREERDGMSASDSYLRMLFKVA